MRTTWRCVAVAALGLLAGVARAEEKKAARPEPPKPGPEVEKLGYFLGEWTSAGTMRHPRYLGLRNDKAPKDVVREP